MYGKTTNSEGKSLENEYIPILKGLHVSGNEIASIEIYKGQDGVEDERRAILTIKQSNGAELKHTVWDGKKNGEPDSGAMDRLNGFMLHVACGTKICSTPEEFASLIGTPSNFKEFITAFNDKIISKGRGKKYTFTIITRESNNGKWYPQIPMFPNFVEPDGTSPTTLFMKKDYIFDAPAVTHMPNDAPASTAVSDDDLF